jgi:hypothetical protein
MKASDFNMQSTPKLIGEISQFILKNHKVQLRMKVTFTTDDDKSPVSETASRYVNITDTNRNSFLNMINSGCLSDKSKESEKKSKTQAEFHMFNYPTVGSAKIAHAA